MEDGEKGIENSDGEDIEKCFTEADIDSAPLTLTPSTSSTAQTQSTPNTEKSGAAAAGKNLITSVDSNQRSELACDFQRNCMRCLRAAACGFTVAYCSGLRFPA